MINYDAHIHTALDGADYKEMKRLHEDGPDEAHIRTVLKGYSDAGFTFLRDGGDKWGCSLLAKSLAPEYGIDYRTPALPYIRRGLTGQFSAGPLLIWMNLRSYLRKLKIMTVTS